MAIEHIPHWIDGKPTQSVSEMYTPVTNPATGAQAGQWLLAEGGQACFRGGEQEGGVRVGRGRDDESVDAAVEQRFGGVDSLGTQPVGDRRGDARGRVGDDQR